MGAGARANRSYLLNARAWSVMDSVLDDINEYVRDSSHNAQSLLSLLERSLENLTIGDPSSSDSGVWVLTPHDLSGLHFDMVVCAGMNSGEFPSLPEQSPVFSDTDLAYLRQGTGAHVC